MLLPEGGVFRKVSLGGVSPVRSDVDGAGGALPPMIHPRRVFCKYRSGWLGVVRLICPTQIMERVGPAPNNKSTGAGRWKFGSASLIFRGIFRFFRSINSSGMKLEIVGMMINCRDLT